MFQIKISLHHGGLVKPKIGGNWPLKMIFWQGGFVWTGFDYRGEPTPYKWPNVNSISELWMFVDF